MEVYALIDDGSAEKIDLKFLKPSSKGERVDISFLSNIPDNIRESADKGIKEAYFLLSHYYANIPERISLWFRGLNKNVQGNSTDLAFAVFLISHMIDSGYINASNTPGKIFATGVILKDGEIKAVTGIRNKTCAAIKQCNEPIDSFLFYPQENQGDIDNLFQEEEELLKEIDNSKIKLIPVGTINDVLKAFGITKEKRNKKKFFRVSVVISIILVFMLTSLLFAFFKYQDMFLGKGTKDKQTPSNHTIQQNFNEASGLSQEKNSKSDSEKSNVDLNVEQAKGNLSASNQFKSVEATGDNRATKAPAASNDLVKEEKFFNVTESLPGNQQENVDTTDSIKVVFSQNGLKPGPKFNQISLNGNSVQGVEFNSDKNGIVFAQKLMYSSNYTVSIPEGALVSSTGAKNKSYIFSFSTKRQNNTFKLVESLPSDGQTNIDVNTEINIYANTTGLSYGPAFSKIYISGEAKIKDAYIAVNKGALVLEVSGLEQNKKYIVKVPEGALLNKDGLPSEGYSFSFSTGN